MMSVESQIGAMIKGNGKTKPTLEYYAFCEKCGYRDKDWRLARYRGVCPKCGGQLIKEIPDKYTEQKYGNMIKR